MAAVETLAMASKGLASKAMAARETLAMASKGLASKAMAARETLAMASKGLASKAMASKGLASKAMASKGMADRQVAVTMAAVALEVLARVGHPAVAHLFSCVAIHMAHNVIAILLCSFVVQ